MRDLMSDIFSNIGGTYGGWIALAIAAVVTVGWRPIRMVWRMASPIPRADAQAIERALNERNQTCETLTKLWFGGPWAYVGPRAPIPYQSGRPYLVRAKGQDGRIVDARLVIDGVDARGDPKVIQRAADGWNTISKLGPPVKTLVL